MRLPGRLFHRRRWRIATLILSAVLGLLVGVGNLGLGLERTLREFDDSLRRHDASGALHIVEIDAHSIAEIDRWPWPRSNYGALVDQLRRAGAASIAFDVDFSSHSDPQQDAAFAAALARAGDKVVLPTFGQSAGGGQQGWKDSLPIAPLRDHATLAAVSILPDGDGYVRRAPIGTMTDGLPRPSLSAMLAGVAGAADADFPIDYAIDPASIPRHSFVDIRDGKFDPAQIAGKHVVIGATAVEMGDRYAVPNYGVIPGVVIQALAAETLAHGAPREAGWVLPLLLALALAWPILRLRRRNLLALAIVAAPAGLFALAVAAHGLFDWIFEIAPALAALMLASLAALTMRVLASAQQRRSHDLQTGLPNRVALRTTPRLPNEAGVIAARFAEFDKLSSALGDAATGDLVKRVHDRIALVAEGGTIYRVEDRVLAWRCRDAERLEERLTTLRTMMLNPVEVAGRRVDVTLALGFAAESASEDNDGALAQAMLAADRALASGASWHVHDANENEAVDRELSLLGELDEAIVKGEIAVVYQPKLCLNTGAIASVEALVRWNHAVRGPLRPDLFIPLAERSDRIAGLTLHVLEQTMRDLEHWRFLGYEITGAVNLSAKLLNSAPFIAELRELVARSTVPPSMLTFEVTESAAMLDAEEAAAALQSFKDLGIAISMDDYGTGQSTLSYLKQLPLNELKIDRSFVQFAHQNRGDGVLVQSTVNLAHELGLKVVAEGVEDEECLAFLKSIGCDLAQGYLISRPVPAAELEALLGLRRAEAA